MGSINFHEWLGNSWGLIFSHYNDDYVVKIMSKFEKLSCKVIGISSDDSF